MELSDCSSSLQGSPENDRANGSLDGDFLFDDENEFISKDYEEGCTLEADNGSLPGKCSLCNDDFTDPVVLSCLHVFDLSCLRDKKAAYVKPDDGLVNGHDGMNVLDTDDKVNIDAILNGNSVYSPTICPKCKSSSGHLDSLPGYYLFESSHVMKNGQKNDEVDGSGDNDANFPSPTYLQCTMCTLGVEAMAKCTDCAEFMCSTCIGAHQSMRLFAGHKWTQLTDEDKKDMASLSKNISKNKPIKCRTHPSEQCKLFCIQCCVLICSDCMTLDHKQHVCERVSDVGGRLRNEILQIRDDARKSVNSLKEVSETLTSMLDDVALARDNNRSSIEETFHSYKTILNEVKEKTLKRNKELHDNVEMEILDRINQIDKTCERFEYASEFLGNYIDNGSTTHLASVMKPLRDRILHLSRENVDTNVETNIPFHTDRDRFKNSVELDFGWLGHPPVAANVCSESNGAVDSLAAAASLWPLNSNASVSMANELLTNGTTFSTVSSSDPSSDLISGLPFNGLSTTGDLGSVGPLGPDFTLPPLPGQRAITSHMPDSVGSGSPTLNGGSPTSLNQVNLQNSELIMGGTVPITSTNNIAMSSSNMTSGSGSGSVSGLSRGLSALNFNQNTNNDLIVSPSCGLSNIPSNSAVSTGSSSNTPRGPTPASGLDGLSSVGDSTLMNSGVGMVGSTILPSTGVSGPSGGTCLPPSVINQPLAKPGGTSGYNPNPNPPFPNRGNRCSQMNVRFRWGQLGSARGQFNSPHGFCLGFEEEIVVADTQNHRIQIFDKEGNQRGCFGVAGREEGQLWYPRKVAIMRQAQKYVICDRGNERSRMQIFTRSGHFVKKIAIRYIDIVAGLAINSYGHIVAVDSVSPTVFVISEAGDLIKWFDCSDYMREPSDIAVSGREYFICDFKGHCVAVFQEDGTFLRRIGSETITNFPNGIDISDHGDVLIGDSHGNRFHVAVYSRVGELMSEFECLQFKVSRCCGLKITSEGYIVTLAKNNHHVLVLNTLYIA